MLRNPVAALIVTFFFIALPPFCGLRFTLRAIALALRAAIWFLTNTNCETRMRTPKYVSPARVLSAGKSEALYSNRVRFLCQRTSPQRRAYRPSPQMNETDRQTKFEADALQDGILRYCQTREYALATDSKPVRDLVADALKPLAQAILQEQLALKAPGSQKLPRYATPPPSISHEKLALITLGTLL